MARASCVAEMPPNRGCEISSSLQNAPGDLVEQSMKHDYPEIYLGSVEAILHLLLFFLAGRR